MHFVYVLFSEKDHRLYIGETGNLKRRLVQHQQGESFATRFRRPIRLIYFECYANTDEAKRRERYLKGGTGRETLKHQLDQTLKDLGYKHQLRAELD